MTVAEINLENIFPLLIGLIWVVAQVFGAMAKKKPAAPRAAGADRNEGENPFADLMRQLSGGQEFKIPLPDELEELDEPEAQEPERPWEPAEIEALPDIEPIHRTVLVPKPKPLEIAIPVSEARPSMSSFKTAMPSMKMPALNMRLKTSQKQGSGIPKVGKIINPADKQTLRRAILGQIILGKPRALESWHTGRVD